MNKEKESRGLDLLFINGDLTQDKTEMLLSLRDKHLSKLEMPYYCNKGNHDYLSSNKGSLTESWKKIWGYNSNHTVVHKDFVFVLGDFNNWIALDNYQMKKTPNSQYFWLELTGLTPNQPYVFQYWMEEGVKVGDPYAEQTADPWNDQWIDEVTFPNLPFYDKTDFGFASVLQTGQIDYPWGPSEDSWERPDVNHLVIYELLVRDFIGTHSWEDLEDSLAYIANLGVDAIEIMPWNEFEGNESWGYNPAYYFAPDKYYGTKEDLKHFIEIAHQHGLAVIMDVVMNHAFGQNPMVKMYFDENT